MLKIGEFSKFSMLTVKTLRFYEKEKLPVPAKVDEWSGYRFYETNQLQTAAKIKALRRLDLSVDEIRAHLNGEPLSDMLAAKEKELKAKANRYRHSALCNKIFIGGQGNEVSGGYQGNTRNYCLQRGKTA